MKITYILNSTISQSGATKSFLILLDGMINKGIKPIIVVPNKNGIYTQLTQRGVEVIDISFRDATYPWLRNEKDYLLFIPRLIGRWWLNFRAVSILSNRLKAERIDIIHSNVSIIDIGYRLSRKLHIPHVYHIREYGDLDFNINYFPSKRIFLKRLRSSQSYSICITKSVQQHHQQISNASSVVIYNGIHEPTEYKEPIINKAYFLYAGRIEPSKGLDYLLEAYANYNGTYPLYIAGAYDRNSDYYKKIISIITEKELNNKVYILGERDDIEDLMQKAIALIVSSPYEAFGRCMAEAMFNCCLVIGHNTSGTKEQFDNGLQYVNKEIGLRYSSMSELTNCLKEVDIMSSVRYDEYTRNALAVVNSLYSTQACIEKINCFYKKVVNESKSNCILSSSVSSNS